LLDNDLVQLPLLEIVDGYWARAGQARRLLIRKGLKAKTADALIAQSCIDHDVALITRDKDFRHFAKHCGLKLA
jgi:predicted nucleic acid-binding protein